MNQDLLYNFLFGPDQENHKNQENKTTYVNTS